MMISKMSRIRNDIIKMGYISRKVPGIFGGICSNATMLARMGAKIEQTKRLPTKKVTSNPK